MAKRGLPLGVSGWKNGVGASKAGSLTTSGGGSCSNEETGCPTNHPAFLQIMPKKLTRGRGLRGKVGSRDAAAIFCSHSVELLRTDASVDDPPFRSPRSDFVAGASDRGRRAS